ncbi:rhomboid family intramembrane serine protease [Clostridium hydrogeniformans]|uniref:rhomboid family intramembrane serine protease n=1 Tax=Clostridium hydrogeniformans TaxID=349933 RepID=UPI0004823175|nr:membrane protein [Clostridium hydrogeniformans]
MNLLDKLEKKFGKLAIKNLMSYIIAANAVIYFLVVFMNRQDILNLLYLDWNLVMKGQVWRLITFVFIPKFTSPFFYIISLYFYYLAGNGLEQYWGSFKFNLFYFCGIVGIMISTYLTNGVGDSTFLNLSLFLAFAKVYPDYSILLFFVLPIKVKYIAIFNWVVIGYNFIFLTNQYRVLIVFCLLNYFIFFGRGIIYGMKNKKRRYEYKAKTIEVNFKNHVHKCEICGITEKEDEYMEFRYCSKCEGLHEYCMNHINNHEHKNEE